VPHNGAAMTHEYTVATNGVVLGSLDAAATAVAWAADTILAAGDDASVRAISRGDSTFVDLGGRAISAGADPVAAQSALRAAVACGGVADTIARLGRIEAGAPADLLIWSHDPTAMAPTEAEGLAVVGTVRAGRLELPD